MTVKSTLNIHWNNWCWSWSSNTLVTWCKELTHLKRPWCWERLRTGGEGGDKGWDIWMASQTQWTWVCAKVGSWCWTGSPSVLWFMGLQKVGNDWGTELNWTDRNNSRHCLVNPDSILLNQKARLVTYELLGVIFVVIGERLTTVVFQVRSWIANLSFES